MIHDSYGDDESVAVMDLALSGKTIERYDREEGWPVLFFEDGASLKFVSNEIDGIAIYRHPDESGIVYRRFRSSSEHDPLRNEPDPT